MTVAVGNNKYVGFGHKNGNSMRYVFNCGGNSLGQLIVLRIFDSCKICEVHNYILGANGPILH